MVSLSPLMMAPMPIAPHAFMAFAAVAVGAEQMFTRKGTKRHRWLGYAWCGMLFFVAVSGFFIHTIKLWSLFSPIHFLSVLTIVALTRAIWCARTGRIHQHQRIMASLFWLALVVTGLFTFLPGRIMFAVVSGA
ncbi:DUF2306 domain-containing protein [Candidatus Puniceispirillum marinum]|nr:DUF2306 domain-containing protein [Candidatus Puniceispirillum marinum]